MFGYVDITKFQVIYTFSATNMALYPILVFAEVNNSNKFNLVPGHNSV